MEVLVNRTAGSAELAEFRVMRGCNEEDVD